MRLRPREQLGVVVEGQPGVQAVDDVDLGDRVAGRRRARAASPTPPRATSCRRRRRPALRRANEQNMQLASQTLVALMCRLRLKKVRSPCSRSRTSLASAPTSSRFGCGRAPRRPRATAARASRACRGCAASAVTGPPPRARRRAEALARRQPRAADQGRRLLAGQRRVVGVGAEAQRALGHDRRPQLVGAEPERHLREAGAQGGDVGEDVRDGRQREAAEREQAERVEAVRLARPGAGITPQSRRREPRRARRSRSRRSASVSPPAKGKRQSTRRPASAAARASPGSRPARTARRRRRARPETAHRGQIRFIDVGLGGVPGPLQSPVATSWRVRTNEPRPVRSSGRAPPSRSPEGEEIERRQRGGCARRRAATVLHHLRAHGLPSSPQRGISWLARPSWSSTRPTTVSSSASMVAGFE